jgi:hypothetical protein
MRLPAERRRELDALAREVGLNSSDLARLGINWLLEHRDVVRYGRERSAQAQEQRAA